MKGMRIAAISWMALGLPTSGFAQADLRSPLPAGIYRFAGKCIELRDTISDYQQSCSPTAAINATSPDAPIFHFFTDNGYEWAFYSDRAKKITAEGKHAEFRLKYFIDLTLNQTHDFDGECVLDLEVGKMRLSCQARRGRKVVRWAAFESGGTFSFSRAVSQPVEGS